MDNEKNLYSRREAISLFLSAAGGGVLLACSGDKKLEIHPSAEPDATGNELAISENTNQIRIPDVVKASSEEISSVILNSLSQDNKRPSLALPLSYFSLPAEVEEIERVGLNREEKKLVDKFLAFRVNDGGVVTAMIPGFAVLDKSQEINYNGQVFVIPFVSPSYSPFNFTLIAGGEIELLANFDNKFQNLPATANLEVGEPIFQIKKFGNIESVEKGNIEKRFPSGFNVWLSENTKNQSANYSLNDKGDLIGSDLTKDKIAKISGKFAIASNS